jgi:hypothetical protein
MMRFRGLLAGAVLVFAAAAMWAGCGVKSPPIPPEYAKPERIMNLTVDSEKRGIELTWGRPDRYAGGDTLRDLAKFVVTRSDAGAPYQQIKDVPVTDQDRFQKQRVFQYLDRNTVVGHSAAQSGNLRAANAQAAALTAARLPARRLFIGWCCDKTDLHITARVHGVRGRLSHDELLRVQA